jgi:type IV pilus assembly protein PilX
VAQRGASLLVALVFLLIMTVLAAGSMREVGLEARITGNIAVQKELMSAAESALRDGERRATLRGPQEPTADCTDIAERLLCLLDRTPSYAQNFDDHQVYSPSDETTLEHDAIWYALIAPSGESRGEAENPEYGNLMQGIGVFRYEVNSASTSNTLTAALRSTTALNSKGRIEEVPPAE